MTTPTLGRIVLYRLNKVEAEGTERRRADFNAYRRKNLPKDSVQGEQGRTGLQAHYGSLVTEGDTFPAIVTYAEVQDGVLWINLQVLLDGNDSLYVIDPQEGSEPGEWSWPPRVDSLLGDVLQ